MNEQYLIDTQGKTIGIVIDPETYHELVQAREELNRLRAAQASHALPGATMPKPHSIRELRGIGKDIWSGIDVPAYIREERDSWDG